MNTKSGAKQTRTSLDKSKQNEIRSEIQLKCVEHIKKRPKLVLNFATGTGKTLSALKCIEEVGGKWYIVCKEVNHIHNWKMDIQKHKLDHLLKNIEFFCYASLKKYAGTQVAGIILDECHAAKSALRIRAINRIKHHYAIALSATINTDTKDALKKIGFKGSKTTWYRISLYKAINLGILPKPRIYLHYMYLDNKERNLKYTYTKGKVNVVELHCTYGDRIKTLARLKREGVNYKLDVLCNEQEYYNILTEQLKFYQVRQSFNDYFKFRFLNLGSTRKRFLASVKTGKLKELIEKTEGMRRVIFTGSIDQCTEVGERIGTIHSKLSNKEVAQTIIDFNSKKLDTIYSVMMIRESANLTDIQLGIMTQLDSSKLTFEQVLGRVLRGDDPEMHIICVKHTQDENYLKEVLKSPMAEFITVIRK